MDYILSGLSVHGILQARVLKWIAMLSSRGSSQSRDQTWVSCIAGGFFTAEPPGKPLEVNATHQMSNIQTWCHELAYAFYCRIPGLLVGNRNAYTSLDSLLPTHCQVWRLCRAKWLKDRSFKHRFSRILLKKFYYVLTKNQGAPRPWSFLP